MKRSVERDRVFAFEYPPVESGHQDVEVKGKQSSTAARAIVEAVRRRKKVRSNATTKNREPSSAIPSSGPVSQPPLNSEARKSSK